MKKKNFYLTIALALLISGCATTQSIPSGERTKIFKSNYSQTFKAVIQTLSNNGYSISTADRKDGIINTDFSNASSLQAFFTGDRRTKINVILNKENNGTEVKLTISVQTKEKFMGWQAATMTKPEAKHYYHVLFSKIASNLEMVN